MADWSSNTLIIYHEITDISSWPLELANITTHLAQPLTAIPNVPPESLSPNALEIYNELTKLPHVSVGGDNDAGLPIQISDVLDTILTSVKMLRELSRSVSHAGTPQPTLPVWRHLLGVLSLACSKDAEILADVPFLLPRTMPLAIEPERLSFEGRASLLVALYIGPKESIRDAMEVDGSASSAADSSGTTVSQTSFIPLSGPMDGHILPGRGKRIDCVVPIICVADEANIRALVTSTVYQKYCWGISLPTIGISIEKSSTIARLIIGWINEGHSSEEHQLPSVHLAFSSASHPSSGVFDLLNPLSALQFTRFILTMHYQFLTIATNLAASRVQGLCWRLDHVVFTNPGHDFHSASKADDWKERIQQWTHDIVLPESSEAGPSAIVPSYISSTGSMANSRASAANSSKPGDSKASTHNSKVEISDSLDVPKDLPKAKDSSSNKPSHFSASNGIKHSFAAKDDSLGANEVGTEHWLWERSTVRLGRIQTYGNSKAEQHMNSMIDYYNSIFILAWPKKWRKTRQPPCDPICRGVLDLLFAQYKEYSSKQGPEGVAQLDKRTVLLLESRISIFLSTVAIASCRAQQAKESLNINEMERRHPIDLLIQSFCCSEDMPISDSFFLELKVRLSKNQAVHDSIQDAAQSRLWDFLATSQYQAIGDEKDPHLLAVAFKALQNAGTKRMQLPNSPYKNQLEATSRLHEPPDATADCVVCTHVPVAQSVSQLPSSQVAKPHSWATLLRKYVPGGVKYKCEGDTTSGTSTESTQGDNAHSAHVDCRMCPSITEHLLPTPTMLMVSPIQSKTYSAADLWVPFLFAEYKRNYSEISKAFHQCQLYVISTVDYLAALGIRDFPIFGIVAAGAQASVMMAWRCSDQLNISSGRVNRKEDACEDINIVIDENLISFNLAEPLDCYRFAVALHRIYQHQQKLKDLLGEIKDLDKKLKSPSFDNWAMAPRKE